jgi:hypothetical protein
VSLVHDARLFLPPLLYYLARPALFSRSVSVAV